MHETPTYVYIPPNISGGGTIKGLIKIRNAIEALVIFGFFILVKKSTDAIVPFEFVGWTFMLIGVAIAIAALMGVNGEPLSVFVLNVINYENRRVFVTLRPPMPPRIEEKETPAEGRLERYINSKKKKKEGEDA